MSGQSNPFISVQPENRTVIEESLEYAWHQVINSLADPFPELKQPLYTPDEFVALLAAERGVMDWRPEDTLEQQRKTADKAFEIHRKAGTRHGLSVAMDALDCDIEVKPWYQMETPPGPYHIEVVAWKRNSPVNKETADRVLARVDHCKSERDTVDLILAFGLESGFIVVGAAHQAVVHYDDACDGVLPPSPVVSSPLALAGAAYHVAVHDDTIAGKLPDYSPCMGTVLLAGVSSMVVITDMNPGAIA